MRNLVLRVVMPLLIVLSSMVAFAPASHADAWRVYNPGTCFKYSFGTQCTGRTYIRVVPFCTNGPRHRYYGAYLSWYIYCIRS